MHNYLYPFALFTTLKGEKEAEEARRLRIKTFREVLQPSDEESGDQGDHLNDENDEVLKFRIFLCEKRTI